MAMLQGFIKFFHHLANPHCAECKLEEQTRFERASMEKECRNCDTLRQMLEAERFEKSKLLEKITYKEPPQPVIQNFVPAEPKVNPFRIRKQQLEEQDREQARILAARAASQSTEKLEETLLEDKKVENA